MFHRILAVIAVTFFLTAAATAGVPFTIQGPGVNQDDFRITEFATGLNFPVGMTELEDGSILVAVSNGDSFFGSASGSLIRLVDTDLDGVADQSQTLLDNVPGGKLSSVRRSDDLIFVTGQGSGAPISIYRTGDQPGSPLTSLGTISINYPGRWSHPHSTLGVRPTPGVANSYDLFFQVGSKTNFDDTTQTPAMNSSIGPNANLAADALHMIQITDNGSSVRSSAPVQIATGLRNAAGMDFHPVTGDLYVQDNGIDGVDDPNEPTSADEINLIAAADIGGNIIEDFGFPNNYIEYRTGTEIGSGGIDPLVAFQPIPQPGGAESEGPNDIAFAPSGFPPSLRNGMFVGMHGKFSLGGVANEENPLVFVDLADNSYFHFIANTEPGVGHLDGLLATTDSLFVSDFSPDGGLGSSDRNEGVIYQIQAVTAPDLGDLDLDGDVDRADLVLLIGHLGSTGAASADFDLNGDLAVTLTDLAIFQENLTPTLPSPAASESPVPEPSTMLLLLSGTVGIAGGWRRRRRVAA